MPILTAREHDRNRALLEAVDSFAAGSIERTMHSLADMSWNLLEGEVDMALAAPLLYSRREADLVLLQGACVAAVGATGELQLQFREGLRQFRTVGFYGTPGMETMLAEIVLREKYRMRPRLVAVQQPPAEALAAVDALLFPIGCDHQPIEEFPMLDVVDEWFDMTQLPFVREVAVAWESRMDSDINDVFVQAGMETDLAVLAQLDEQMHGRGTESNTESLPAHYRYRFTEDAQEGLKQFFQHAYFHGLHRDIPNFTFWSPEETTEENGEVPEL